MAEIEMDEFDVAVVVYCRAGGVDESDAQSRAERAVGDRLRAERPLPYPISVLGSSRQEWVAGTSGLSHAHVVQRPDATMFKRVGMVAPRKSESTS